MIDLEYATCKKWTFNLDMIEKILDVLDENSIDYSIDTIGKDEVDSVIPFKRQTINKVKTLRFKN